MPVVNYNPGEPVFDMSTGEPYITPDGELVEVQPGLKVQVADGRVIDGDDVANAAYYRANLFQGEAPRDASAGVPYLRLALGQMDQALAISLVVGEVRSRTPGVAGVVAVRAEGLGPRTRVMRFSCALLRQDGSEQTLNSSSGGV